MNQETKFKIVYYYVIKNHKFVYFNSFQIKIWHIFL